LASVLYLLHFLPLLLLESWWYQLRSSSSLIAYCLTQSVNVIIFLIEQCQLNSFNAIV
jgi:hypothetical protein